jgi:HSP20 family molecular chaperone IbpA
MSEDFSWSKGAGKGRTYKQPTIVTSFGRSFMSDLGEFGRGLWSPQIETFEREGQLVIRADLPGALERRCER